MVVSKYIKSVIDKNYLEIRAIVPLVDISYDLRAIQILSNEEVEKLRDDCKSDKERAFEFLKILESSSDENFYQFCSLLKVSNIRNVQKLGERLEKEAYKTTEIKEHSKNHYQVLNNLHQSIEENPILHPFRNMISKLLDWNSPSYTSSSLIDGTLESSFNSLDEDKMRLFEQLAVFKRVNIPIQSVVSLWNCNQTKAHLYLTEMNNKSLLTYEYDADKSYCVLHDLMVDYLHQRLYSQTSSQDYCKILNKMLIDGYRKQCDGRWNTFHDDGYFYLNLIYHALIAESNEDLQTIMTDFNWMKCKIQSDKTIYNLVCDLTDYIDYLKERKENGKDLRQLVVLLKQQQPRLDAVDADIIKMILWDDMSDSWMKKRALQLAKENVRNGDDNLSYWSMSECSTGATTTEYTYDVCQRFGKNEHDKFISVSNPDFGPLRIIGSENNGTQDVQIVIKDYQTSKIELKISPYTWIDSVEISADGRTVAFKSNEWIVHDIDKNKEIDFAKNEEGKVIKTDFCSLQFCPAVSETKVIMTLSKDRREVTIWKIEGNCIRPLNKRILCQYNIRYCQWVQVHDSVRVLLGWRNFNEFGKSRHTSDDPLNKINEWQIEIWHVQRWTCLSLKVPDYIHAKDDGRYFATNDSKESLFLNFINTRIYLDATYIILAYTGSNLETNGTIGLLKMKQFGKMEFENEFRPILHHIPRVENISVSDDQQMIFIYFARARDEYYRRSYMGTFDCRENKKLILKMRCCQVQSCVQVEQSGPPMLIPGSNRLLIYDRSQTHNVYEYNLQGDKIAWQDIPQSKSYDDLKRSEITVPESTVPETSVNIFNLQMIEFLGIEDCRKHRELIYQLLVKESNDTAFMYIRYRKKDNTLIFMQHKTILSQNWIITISLTTGKKIIDRPACIAKANIRYFDDDYLYAWECEEPNSNSYSFKCYKIGDGEYHMKLLQTIRYKHVEKLIFKITMNYNSNGANYNPTIEQSSFSKEKVLVDAWGERDANMIANLPEKYRHENYFLLLENGDHIAIIARTNQLFMKRYKDNIKYFDSRTQFFNPENLWSDKHLILYEYDRVQSKFNIYNAQTLQLQIILPFTHFGVEDIQWNLQQSQLIIKGFKDYCLVTVIE